jgi:phosphoribosylaminoimidazole (AIR) synthetase
LLQRAGGVDRDEMYRVFNMGAGMILVVAKDQVDPVLQDLRAAGEAPWVMGEVEQGKGVRYGD